jgi:hypothetical protein
MNTTEHLRKRKDALIVTVTVVRRSAKAVYQKAMVKRLIISGRIVQVDSRVYLLASQAVQLIDVVSRHVLK